jgi:TRAP-type C4-dicarboxylate transport system permease small subunit
MPAVSEQDTGSSTRSARVAAVSQKVLGGALMVCVLLNFANVVARYVFNKAIFGIEEVQVYIVVAICFLGAVLVTFRHGHLRMDALVHRFSERTARIVGRVESALVVVLVSFVCVQSARFTWQMIQIGRKSDLMEIPMWVPHGSVTLGLFMVAALCAWRLLPGRDTQPQPDAVAVAAGEVQP